MPLSVLSIAQMREWEKATWAAGQTEAEVIRRVGARLAQRAMELTPADALVLIVAGKGNNGADARAARALLKERRVDVLEVTAPADELSRLETELSLRPALIIDGLFGIGLNRPLAPEWCAFIEAINRSGRPILSVDVPSGLNSDSGEPQGAAIQATVTLTVGAPKLGLLQSEAAPFVGRLEVASEIGLAASVPESELRWTVEEDFRDFPPRRAVATHKGSYGHVALIAGSVGFHGAAVLSALGAQRAQPGLITVHTLESVYHAIAAQLAAVMVSPAMPHPRSIGTYTGFLAGPGLAAPEAAEGASTAVRHVWRDAPVPVVADASALDWLTMDAFPKGAIRVITPHPGEAGRLLRSTAQQVQANRVGALRQLSKRFGNCWVVLKGHQTLVGRSTGEIFVNSSGNPHLAQGGSGDLLSGYIAGLLAQPALRPEPGLTLRYAVWQHGAAADLLQRTRPNWRVEDLAETLGSIPSPS